MTPVHTKLLLILCILLSYSSALAAESLTVATCMQAFREQKLVLLCLQNTDTTDNEAALVGVHEFQTNSHFQSEVVIIDPANPNEHTLLTQLDIQRPISQAMTVLIAPPGRRVAIYYGPTEKEQFERDLRPRCSCGCQHCNHLNH